MLVVLLTIAAAAVALGQAKRFVAHQAFPARAVECQTRPACQITAALFDRQRPAK